MTFSRYNCTKATRRLKSLLLVGSTFCAALLLPGCATDDFNAPVVEEPGTLTIIINDRGTRAITDQGYQTATDDERNVNDLCLFAFPKDEPDALGTRVDFDAADFTLPTSDELGTGKTYVIKGFPEGDYRLYLVGNMGAELAGKYGITENSLKQEIINHNERLSTTYKLGDKMNLPMIFEPTNTDYVTISKTQGASATLPLKFACVKVAYRILFDSSDENLSKEWGSTGFEIFNVSASNLPENTLYVQDAKKYGVMEGTKSFGAPEYAPDWDGEYEDAETNDNVTDDISTTDIITPIGNVSDINWSTKHVAYGTLYLPEQYQFSADEENAPCIILDGIIVSGPRTGPTAETSADKTYTIVLGEEGKNSLQDFPRGTYYEIIGKLKNPLATRIDATVVIKDWTVHNIAGDLSHPTLWVDKTRASVTSIDRDSIQFNSNVKVDFFCEDDPLVNKPIITTVGKSDDGYIRFRVNPNIPFDKFGDGTNGTIPEQGEITVCLKAGHLKKYVTVQYDVSPLFEIEPRSQILFWDDNTLFRQANFSYTTNLGGVSFDASTVTADEVLEITNVADETGTQGTIHVEVKKDPEVTKTYKLKVSPENTAYSKMAQTLTIIVKPKADKYRIYFRPINDIDPLNEEGQPMNNKGDAIFDYNGDYSGKYPGDTDKDGWAEAKLYMYAQYGETVDGYIPSEFVWLAAGDFPGTDYMKKKGRWYAWEYSLEHTGTNGESTLQIEPGETLIIFSKNGDGRHRCPHNLDPGISLFNFEDKEGYYVYDPLCYPYYKIFDEEPIIKNVKYLIYSKEIVSELYINYGGTNNNDNTLKINNPKHVSKKLDGETWYITEFCAEAPVGDYSKALKVKFGNNDIQTLFGNKNFYNAASQNLCEGIYYGNNVWKKGNLPLEDLTTKTIYVYKDPSIKASGKLSLYIWNGPEGENTESFPGFDEWENLGDGWYAMTIHNEFKNAIISMGSSATQTTDIDISDSGNQYFRYYHDSTDNAYKYELTNNRP